MIVWELLLAAILLLAALAGARRVTALIALFRDQFVRTGRNRLAVSRASSFVRSQNAGHRGPLSPEEHAGFEFVWQSVRKRFERDPNTAISYADLLISDLLHHHGCCNGKGTLSSTSVVDELTEKYQHAHSIAFHQLPKPTTRTDLERVMLIYEEVFQRFVGGPNKPQSDSASVVNHAS
jgi:hypothetical protein